MESISSVPVQAEVPNLPPAFNTAALEWLTPSEAAAHLRVNSRTLLRWVRERTLRAYALSGTKRRIWRFLRTDLDAALIQNCSPTQQRAETSPEPRTRVRHQKGSVVLDRRNNSWHYLWRDDGHRRSKLIGTKRDFPTKSAAWEAAESFRLEERIRRQQTTGESTVTVKSLTEAYRSEKMPTRIDTRRAYEVWLKHYILPRFGSEPISSVQSRVVELWLNELKLSPKSKVHIRGLLRILWDYAQWRGDVPTQRNPMELVSVKNASKRVHLSRSLTVPEFRKFVAALDDPFGLVALLCVSLGLRISEALALKWADFDSTARSVRVERAIVCQNVDEVKSMRSKKVLPLDPRLLAMVEKYRRDADYSKPGDWVFASPVQGGRLPWSYDQIWRVYQKAAKAAGFGGLGTHSLRHTYRSWLDAAGTSIAVQQKLMRHADVRTTMNVYGDVVTDEMQVANRKVLRMALSKSPKSRKRRS